MITWLIIFSAVIAASIVGAVIAFMVTTSEWYCKKMAKVSAKMTDIILKNSGL